MIITVKSWLMLTAGERQRFLQMKAENNAYRLEKQKAQKNKR